MGSRPDTPAIGASPAGYTSVRINASAPSNALAKSRHNDAVKQTLARKKVQLGLRHFSREDLEAVRATGEMLQIRVLGLASIANDVTPELACATIKSIEVLGALHASSVVKAALAARIR